MLAFSNSILHSLQLSLVSWFCRNVLYRITQANNSLLIRPHCWKFSIKRLKSVVFECSIFVRPGIDLFMVYHLMLSSVVVFIRFGCVCCLCDGSWREAHCFWAVRSGSTSENDFLSSGSLIYFSQHSSCFNSFYELQSVMNIQVGARQCFDEFPDNWHFDCRCHDWTNSS